MTGGEMMLSKLLERIYKIGYSLLAIIIFASIWEIAGRSGVINPTFLPPFSKVAVAFWNLAITGVLFRHLLVSLQRAVLGFAAGLALSVPLGLFIGWYKGFERFIDPLLQTFRQTSALSLFPVFILLFGIGEASKVAIIFWGVQWPILLNTIAGVKNVEPLLIKSAHSMGASSLTMFFKVIIPGAFPSIFTGLRLSATYSILILIAAEMIGSNAGLGFLLYTSETNFQIPDMYAAIITMSLLGLTVNYLLMGIGARITRWKEDLPMN
jgi:NitT/TauT family transport system permease protein